MRIAGPGVYRGVTVGDVHACAVTISSTVNCWGANTRGQLGDGSTTARAVPTPLAAAHDVRFVQAVAGSAHSCALADDGQAYCWGANDRGQLGVGPGPDRRSPAAVSGAARFQSLAAGAAHTCGVTDVGTVWCWGANARKQLGSGPTTGSSVPIAVPVPTPATAVTAGALHTCVLGDGGEGYCWGAANAGQLGIGAALGDVATPTRVATPQPLTAIVAGAAHTCATTNAGALVCWGQNADGELGDATRVAHALPASVDLDAPRRAPPPTLPTLPPLPPPVVIP